MSWQALGIRREQEVEAADSVNEFLEQRTTFIDENKLIDYNEMTAENFPTLKKKTVQEAHRLPNKMHPNPITPRDGAIMMA